MAIDGNKADFEKLGFKVEFAPQDDQAYTPITTNPQITDCGYQNAGRISGRDDTQGISAATFAFAT